MSEPLPSDRLEFDLSSDAAGESKAQRSSIGPIVGTYVVAGVAIVALGVFTLTGSIVGTTLEGWAAIVSGIVIVAGGTVYVSLYLGKDEVIRLAVDGRGLTFTWTKGEATSLAWSDPGLKVDLNHLEGDPTEVLPADDPRNQRPWWIDVWKAGASTIALETTLPEGAYRAVLEEAGRRVPGVQTTPAAYFWWQPSPRVPGEVHHRSGSKLKPGERTNGTITRIRGTSAHDR
ncbi:MAG TPA: hypothetical protein VFG07_09010 [Thermoplasmata archaeon]|nr:hypothetical protein [Thermoplasmata archaeon]